MTSLMLMGMAVCPQVVIELPSRASAAEKQDAATSRPAAVVTYRVIGLMKTKSGATWMGWPSAVTKSLEGTKTTVSITWDYAKDEVTIRYRPQRTSAKILAEIITAMGYRVEQVQPAAASKPVVEATRYEAPLPDDAPKFFREAFERARKKKLPIVIDFWATWCAPCIRLKKETLSDGEVKKRLKKVELIDVDVDRHPSLAKAYGVASVPDVFLIDADGLVVDRLRNFEPPGAFRVRLERLIGHERSAPAAKKNQISPWP